MDHWTLISSRAELFRSDTGHTSDIRLRGDSLVKQIPQTQVYGGFELATKGMQCRVLTTVLSEMPYGYSVVI